VSHWNYRIFRHKSQKGDCEFFTIHECYYGEDGKPNGWTVKEMAPYSESVKGLKDVVLRMMKEAFDKPVLDYYD